MEGIHSPSQVKVKQDDFSFKALTLGLWVQTHEAVLRALVTTPMSLSISQLPLSGLPASTLPPLTKSFFIHRSHSYLFKLLSQNGKRTVTMSSSPL